MTSSSQDLHPRHGARFVARRIAEDPLEYEVDALLPDEIRLTTRLRWADGRATLEPAWADAWAVDEVLKLARVLKRTKKARDVRWRDRDIHRRDPLQSS